MLLAASSFILLVLLSLVLLAGTRTLALSVAPEANRSALRKWLLRWSLKGGGLPCLAWGFLNIGLLLPPLMPTVQKAAYLGDPWPAFLRVLGAGTFVIVSYWAAVTLGWVLLRLHRDLQSESRFEFHSLLISSGLGMGIVSLIILLVGGWPLLGLAFFALFAPAVGYAPSTLPRKLPPIYARAIAKMKFGKYTEAEWEIIRQLEQCEDDYQGWLMMAELYALHFKNLVEAEHTILEICDQPSTNKSQLSVALHKLADWHLTIGNDPNAAARALQMIEDRCPGTHLAHMAQLRRRQLPVNTEELQERRNAAPVPLPALGDSLEQTRTAPLDEKELRKAKEAAHSLQQRLLEDPDNVSIRERLARIDAEQLGKAADAIAHIEALLQTPDQADQKRAEWLSMIAAWEFKYRSNHERSMDFLERIVREHPQSVQAFAARLRLQKLNREGPKVQTREGGS